MKLSEGIYIKDRGLARKAPQGVFASIARKDNDEILCYVSKDIVDDEESILDIKILSREKSEKFRFWNNEKGSIYNYPYTPVFCRNGEYSVKISLEEASLNEIRGCDVFYVKEFELKNIRNLNLHSDVIFTPMVSEKISLTNVTDSCIDLILDSDSKDFDNERMNIDELVFNNVQNLYLKTTYFLNGFKRKILIDDVFCGTVDSKRFLIDTIQEEHALEDFKIEITNATFDFEKDAGENKARDNLFKELRIRANSLEIRGVTVTVRGKEYHNHIYAEKGIRIIGKDFTLSELILGTQGKEGVNIRLRSLNCLFDGIGNKNRRIVAERVGISESFDLVLVANDKDVRVDINGSIRHKDDNSYGKITISQDFFLDVFSVMLVESDSVEFSEFSSQNSFIKIDSSQKKLGNINIKKRRLHRRVFRQKG